MIIGLDIGGHHAAGALVAPGSWAIEPDTYRHVETASNADAGELLDSWAGLIQELAVSSPENVTQVGIAIPGPFDYRTGTAFFKGNQKFEALYGVEVGRELGARFNGAQSIRFLNDATAFAVGSTASALPRDRVLALTLGTGLGSAFLEKGVPVVDDASGAVPEDGCLWHLAYRESIADDYVSSRWITAEARRRFGLDCAVAALADLARDDLRVRAIFEEYGANLAQIIAPWVRSFSPDAIVMGGRITRAFDLFSPGLRDELSGSGALRPILIHEKTEDAAIVGGAKTFDEAFWNVAQKRLPTR